MLAVHDGDLAKLGELFEKHNRPLYGFFVRLTGDRIASEDLVQLVFYRILKYRRTYRDEGKFSAWIYHIVRRNPARSTAAGPKSSPRPCAARSLFGKRTECGRETGLGSFSHASGRLRSTAPHAFG